MRAVPNIYLFLPLFLLLIIIPKNCGQYVPPTPTVEPLYPKGLRMSIPHEDGISLVAYHVKFNEDFNGLEAGTIARDIVKINNGQWVYEDKTTRLRKGDILYYWIHVVYDGLGYNLVDQRYTVAEFYNYDGSPVTSTTADACKGQSETVLYDWNLRRKTVCSQQLIFEETFSVLNTSRWMIMEQFSEAPNYEFVVYMNIHENINVKDGILNIKPTLTNDRYGVEYVRTGRLILDRCTGEVDTPSCRREAKGWSILPPIISGLINTKPSFIFTYGRIEVRAKLPRGDWLYPMINLISVNEHDLGGSYYSRIIIAHANGNPILRTSSGSDMSGNVLIAGGLEITRQNYHLLSNRDDLPIKISNSPWSDDYHVYEIEWRRGQIAVKVDGVEYGEKRLSPAFENPVFLSLGVGAGGLIFFPDGITSGDYIKPWTKLEPQSQYDFFCAQDKWYETWKESDTGLHVDYVKVWSL